MPIMGGLIRAIRDTVIVGVVVGSIANMILVMAGPGIIPPPDGVDVTNVESIRSSMRLFEFRHFIFPFLAHALGTLAGAYLAAQIAASCRMAAAMVVGGLFLIGGIVNVIMIGGPVLFNVVDLVCAYVPMAWIGAKLTGRT